MCELDWRCRKRGAQAMLARPGDVARVTRARQCQSFECAVVHCSMVKMFCAVRAVIQRKQYVYTRSKDLRYRVRVTPARSPWQRGCTAGYLSFGPIENAICFCDLSVCEKDWRGKRGL